MMRIIPERDGKGDKRQRQRKSGFTHKTRRERRGNNLFLCIQWRLSLSSENQNKNRNYEVREQEDEEEEED